MFVKNIETKENWQKDLWHVVKLTPKVFLAQNGNFYVTRYSLLLFEVENFQTKSHHLALKNDYHSLTRNYYVHAY
jgi:hypothetical protein